MPISVGPYSQAEINAATVNVSASVSDVNTFGTTSITIASASFGTGSLPVTATIEHPVTVTGSVEIIGGVQFTGSITALNNSVEAAGAASPNTATLVGGVDDLNIVSMWHVDTNGVGAVYISSSADAPVYITGSNMGISGTIAVTSSQANPVWITGSNMGISGVLTATLTGAMSVVDPGNSRNAPLGANGVFIGTAVDTLGYESISYNLITDQLSAAVSGVQIQFSNDASLWETTFSRAVTAANLNAGTDLVFRPHGRWFRLVYTNGATPQATMSLQTTLNRFAPSGDTVGVDKLPVAGQDALLVKAVLAGKNTSGSYVDIQVDDSGTVAIHGVRSPTDNYPNPSNAINDISLNMVWDSDAQVWVRVGKGDIDADNDVLDNVGLTKAESYVKVFNGINFDRLRGDTTGTWVKIVSSIPLSATISGTVPVSMTNFPATVNVTASSASPVWVTSTAPNIKIATDNAQYVTSSQALPVWTTGTATVTGTLSVAQTGAFVVTGTVTAAFTGTQTVSQSNPVLTSSVTQTGSWQVAGTVTAHTDGLVGVSGAVAITSGVLTSITNPVTTVGLHGVTGTVSVLNSTGTLNVAQTGSWYVTSSQGNPLFVTGTITTVQSATGTFVAIEASVTGIGQPIPASATLIGAHDDTGSLAPLHVDKSGNLYVVISGTTVGAQQVFGLVGATGTVAISSGVLTSITNPVVITATIANPAWVAVSGNMSASFSGVMSATISGVVQVTSTSAAPVWTTGTTTLGLTGVLPVSLTGVSVNGLVGVSGAVAITSGTITSITNVVTVTGNLTTTSSIALTGALPVSGLVGVSGTVAVTSGSIQSYGLHGVSGTVAITSGVLTSITNPVVVTSTSANPVWTTGTTTVTGALTASLALTGALPVTGLVGVSGTVAITSGSIQSYGLHGVSGTVAITSGTLTGITNPVVVTSTNVNPVWTTGTTTVTGALTASVALTGALPITGLVGVSGTVAVTSGTITTVSTVTTVGTITNNVHTDGLQGVTGTVAISSGVLTSITNPVTVTSSFTSPVYVTSTIANPVMVSGAVTIATTGILTVSQSNMPNVLVVTSALGSPVFVTSTIANPVNITASQANPVTVAITGALPVTGTVTLGLTSSIVTVGLMGVTGTVNVANSSGVLNVAQTGTWIVGGTVTASFTGTQTVSQSNPVLTSSVTQTGSWVVTGSVTTNVPAFSFISGAITNAGDTVTLAIGTAVGVMFSCEGTFSGNIRPQISYNGGANWHIVEVVNPDYAVENLFTRISSSGVYQPYYIAGATHVRLSATAMSSGQASVYINTNNVPAHVDMTAVENGEAIPKYGAMIGGNDGGLFRFVKVDQSGALYMSASQDRPVWVTGAITSYASATGTFVAIENSVGGVGNAAPVSATLIGGNNGGNLQNIIVDSAGRQIVTGTVNVNQTGALMMTASQANPVWITGSIATTTGTQSVTSTLANPVWITGTTTVGLTGTLPITGTVTINHSASIPVTLTGTTVNGLVGVSGTVNVLNSTGTLNVGQTGTWMVSSTIANPVNITASQASPVTVAITGTWPVTGTVTIGLTSALGMSLTGVTVNQTGNWQVAGAVTAHADGLMGVSGTVAITSGTITTVTNPVVVTSTFASPVYVSSTLSNPVNTVGLHGVSGTVAITSGVLTSITNPVQVTSTQAAPIWITGTLAGISGSVTTVLSGVTVNQTATWQTALTGVTVNQTGTWMVSSTIANPVNVFFPFAAASNSIAPTTGVLNAGRNPVNSAVHIINAHGTDFDGEAVQVSGALEVDAHLKAFNGTTYDRVRALGVGILQVSSTIASPVNVTGTVTLGLTSSLAMSLTGVTVNQTSSWVVSSTLAAPLWVTASSANPVFVGFTGTQSVAMTGVTVNYTSSLPVSVTGVTVNYTGTVPVSLTGATVNQTGTWIVSSTIANPVNVTGTVTLGLTSALAISLTGVTVNQTATWQAAMTGVTVNYTASLPVIVTGTTVNQTGSWVVSSTLAAPLWVTASSANPVFIGQTGTLTVSQSNSPAGTSSITGTVTIGLTGTVPVSLTGVTVNQTATWLVSSTIANPVNVTASSANPVSVTIVGGSSAGKQYLTGTDLNGGTGTLMIGVDSGNVARAALMTSQGWLAVSQTNPGSPGGSNAAAIATGTANPTTGTLVLAMNGGTTIALSATSQGFLAVSMTNGGTSGGGTQYGTGSTPANMTGTVSLGNAGGTVVPLSATAGGVQIVTLSGTLDAVFSGTQVVTSSQANPVWITSSATAGGGVQYGTGSLIAAATGTVIGGVGTNNDFQAAAIGGNSGDGEASRASGVLEVDAYLRGYNGTTFDRIRTLGVGILQVSSTIANPVMIAGAGTITVTSTVGNGVYVTSTLTNPVQVAGPTAGLIMAGTVTATGAQTPSDAFANPTTALLAWALNAQWDGTQWVRQRGGVSGTLVQTKPAATTTVTQVSVSTATTILAANTNRLGASIQSVASAAFAVHVKLGSAATLASYTVRIAQNGYYEVPANYNGIITGICSGSQAVQVHVTEITQ